MTVAYALGNAHALDVETRDRFGLYLLQPTTSGTPPCSRKLEEMLSQIDTDLTPAPGIEIRDRANRRTCNPRRWQKYTSGSDGFFDLHRGIPSDAFPGFDSQRDQPNADTPRLFANDLGTGP